MMEMHNGDTYPHLLILYIVAEQKLEIKSFHFS